MQSKNKSGNNLSVYVYLFGVYFILIFGYCYSVDKVAYGIIWLLFSGLALSGFLLFVAINHILLKTTISHRKLLIIESLILITLIAQISYASPG